MQKQKKSDQNRAADMQAVAFNTVLPYAAEGVPIPPALRYDDNGEPYLTVYAPDAAAVELACDDRRIPLQKQQGGFWKAELKLNSGFYYARLKIDGAAVLSPMLPIGYGYSRPCNYLEIKPMEECCLIEDVPHGSVAHEYYFSKATGSFETCVVYTPPGYQDGGKSYPVLYLQHGYGENETGWVWQGKVNFILDNLIAQGKAVPMVVVMNNGMVQVRDAGGAEKVDYHVFETQLIGDVIPFIEKKYRIMAGRENHAMAGLSMGSMQTSIITFKHPELFAWIGLFSGFMRDMIAPGNDAHLKRLKEQPEEFNAGTKLLFRGIGRDDCFFSNFLEDDQFCREKGIRNVRKEYPGKHDWNVWRKCIRDFSQLVFKG